MGRMKPDFLIIGAAKSGTNWLATNLRRNPGCFISDGEIHYFSRFHDTEPPEWYAAFFAGRRTGQIAGERSNTYMTDPQAAARIHAALPDARLLAILRNPIERAYSGYCMRLDRGFVSEDIASHLDPANPLSRGLLLNGLYSRQLAGFRERFPRRQLHVAIHDDITLRPAGLLGEISAFLGVPHDFDAAPLKERTNVRKSYGVKRGYKRLLGPLMRNERLRKGISRTLNASAIGRSLLRLGSGELKHPPLTGEVRARLASYYADEVALLSDYTGRDLGGWLAAEKSLP